MEGRRLKTLIVMNKLYKELKGPPTVRQVVEEMGLRESQVSSVYYHIKALQAQGFVADRRPRGMYAPVVTVEEAQEVLRGRQALEALRARDGQGRGHDEEPADGQGRA